MDEELSTLRRAVLADPGNQELAQQYERALLRSGARLEVTERYRFKFLCGFGFDELDATKDPWIRHCAECARDVHLVTSPEQLTEAVAAGKCVAVQLEGLDQAIESLVDDPRAHSAEETQAPCVIGRKTPQPRPIMRGRIRRRD